MPPLPEYQRILFNAWLAYYRLAGSGQNTQAIQHTIESAIVAYILHRGDIAEDLLQQEVTTIQAQAEAQFQQERREHTPPDLS